MLQVPYAESLNLVFLVWVLLLMMRKQYLLMMPVALLACLSRPVGVPLGATAGLWWFACLITEAKAQQQRRQRGEDQEGFESVSYAACRSLAVPFSSASARSFGQSTPGK